MNTYCCVSPKSFIYNRRSYSFENVTLKLLIALGTQALTNVVLRCEDECKRFPSGHIGGSRLGQLVVLLVSCAMWWRQALPSEPGGFGDLLY